MTDREAPRLSALAVTSKNPAVRTRWRMCLDRWGDAFVAFSQLGLPELFTEEVSEAFESLYGGSYSSLLEAAVGQIDILGWKDALHRLRRDEGISDDVLDWDYDAIIVRLSDSYEFVRAAGKVHLFAK